MTAKAVNQEPVSKSLFISRGFIDFLGLKDLIQNKV